jgi:alpha-D-ribose 1-methylphosphonate 5-triphosphate synthase subunit PhnG
MQTATEYIPAAIFLAIVVLLVWAGFRRTDRIRAKAAAQMDAHLKAVNRNTEAVERIASALEAKNQTRPSRDSN